MIDLYFKPLIDDVKKPVKAHETDAGFDLFATQETVIFPNKQTKLSTGIAVQGKFVEPKDAEKFRLKFQVEGTSGNASKLGIFPIGGVVDEGYIGEVGVVLCNHTADPIRISAGAKIAQLVPEVIPKVRKCIYLNLTDEFEKTERGENGFGSTGTAVS